MVYHVGPGSFFTLDRPCRVTKWMSGGSIPLLYHGSPARPVFVSSRFLPEVPFDTSSDNMQGYFFKGVKVYLQNFNVVDTPCTGSFCDSLELVNLENTATCCSCYQRDERTSTFVFALSLVVVHPVRNLKFLCPCFTSKSTTRFFIMDGVIPTGVTTAMIRNHDLVEPIIESVQDVINRVNSQGGWNVRGWLRRGHVKDQGVEQGLGRAETKTTVSSKAIYHISHLEPSNLHIDNLATNTLKFNMKVAFDRGFGSYSESTSLHHC